jgi:predicted HicB family RNase H-like nuclease
MSNANLLKYKGYFGTVEFSFEDSCIWGKIQFINDVVTYESNNADNIQDQFESAVDEYLETCLEFGKEPDKTLSGTFNIRIGSELHKKALVRSKSDGITLNEVIKISVDQYVNSSTEIHHHVSFNVNKSEASESTITAQTFEKPSSYEWKPSKEIMYGNH